MTRKAGRVVREKLPTKYINNLTIVNRHGKKGRNPIIRIRIWFLILWRRARSNSFSGSVLPISGETPRVTVQLPLYNECFVAERLLDAAARLAWSKDRLVIQVLDDSTDTTREIVDERAAYWRRRGVCMQVIRRNNRDGFKAGALAHGLERAKGGFIAVFDADFVPGKDFLLRTVSQLLSLAAISGLLSKGGIFHRTPKYGVLDYC
jgi:cellulose synthase/poly-beta-1,6-N-acetylglucosamine synthase-like glycosyltransferase